MMMMYKVALQIQATMLYKYDMNVSTWYSTVHGKDNVNRKQAIFSPLNSNGDDEGKSVNC